MFMSAKRAGRGSWKIVLASLLVFVAHRGARAQVDGLMTLTLEGTSKASSSVEAAREIQNTLTAETARSQIIDIIGEKRYQKYKNSVESKIIKQSAKFIPFVAPGQPVAQPDGSWKMPLELKLSASSLRKMIINAGLLNDAEGPAALLPLIAFVDRKSGALLRWWQGEPKDDSHKFLSQLSSELHSRLQTEFSRQGFHLIKPLGLRVSPLPEALRSDRLSGADVSFVSDYFGAPMVLRGDVRFREMRNGGARSAAVGQIALKLEVLQVSTGRVVAEVSRQFDADGATYEPAVRSKLAAEMPEIAKDLASQVLEAWQRGTLSSNVVRLTLNGQLTPKQLGEFKSSLLQGVRDVKVMKERLFEFGHVVYEVDYAGEFGPLEEKLKGLKMTAFDTRVSKAGETGLVMEVRAR